MSKKGTEKPIEIFVALFVILAVALVMLQLFQGQITEQRGAISEFEQQQQLQRMQDDIGLHCLQQCTRAENDGRCSLQALASLCMAGTHQIFDDGQFIDFDGDNRISYNTDQYGGEGVCEDQIYCFTHMERCCNRQINAESCADILNQFWNSRGWDSDSSQRENLCQTNLRTGSCSPDSAQESLAWWNEFVGPDNVCENGIGSN